MREFELIDAWSRVQQEIFRSVTTTSCWRCNEGANKGKVIKSPCKCTNQFIHVHCLEISANTRNILHCQFCRTRYPLEIKHKSLLECYRDSTLLQMLREIRAPLFDILILIFFYSALIIVLIYALYVIISFNNIWYHKIFIIMVNLYLWAFIFFIYMTMPHVIYFNNRIREIYSQWYKSTQELKLMEQYPNNIRVI